MDQGPQVSAALSPWLAAVGRLAGRLPLGAAGAETLAELRTLLDALAQGAEAVPAEVPASGAPLEGWLRQATRPAGFNQVRRRREALLRLAAWRALETLESSAPQREDALDSLQSWMGRPELDVPPGLGPSLAYAASASALRFFDRDLRAALRRLAQRHDVAGARFAALADAGPYEPSAAAAHGWSRAWSAAVAAVYLDWLRQGAQGRLDAAMAGLWNDAAVRFRAPSGLVVLPTRERSMHIDLWTTLVPAQALEHRAARFERAAEPWHRVSVAMHDLGERDRGSGTGARTLYRGLGVEMLYQAVFAERALQALAPRATAETVPTMRAPQLVVDVPPPRPGQQANFELVLRWHEPPGPTRRLHGEPAVALTDVQRRVLERWQRGRNGDAGTAEVLTAAAVDWHPAADTDRFTDDEGRPLAALGHGTLWRAAGESADWIDVALVVRDGLAGWHELPLVLHEEARHGELRTWLLLPPGGDGADLPALRRALAGHACWSLRHAGVGAFVMAGVALDDGGRG